MEAARNEDKGSLDVVKETGGMDGPGWFPVLDLSLIHI